MHGQPVVQIDNLLVLRAIGTSSQDLGHLIIISDDSTADEFGALKRFHPAIVIL